MSHLPVIRDTFDSQMDLIIKEKWEDKNINKSETIEFDFKTS